MSRRVIYRFAFWLTIACWLSLALGMALEGIWRIVPFDFYIGFFLQFAVIFTIVSAFARPKKMSQATDSENRAEE